jgi:hypothetical protein
MPGRVLKGAVCGAAVAVAAALSGCGAQDAAVLETAFKRDITRADVAMSFDVRMPGDDLRMAFAGPYRSNGEEHLPDLDWRIRVEGVAGHPLEGRLIAADGNAFVRYAGETYEVGRDRVRELERSGADEPTLTATDVRKLMQQARDWFPEGEGHDADLGGERVTRFSGKLDLSAALTDLRALAKRPGMSGVEELKQLSARDIHEVERSVSDPRFIVDVARGDGKLRRIDARMRLTDGGQTGTLRFAMRFRHVDEPVSITAPSSGRPLEELAKKLQDDLGGLPASAPGP